MALPFAYRPNLRSQFATSSCYDLRDVYKFISFFLNLKVCLVKIILIIVLILSENSSVRSRLCFDGNFSILEFLNKDQVCRSKIKLGKQGSGSCGPRLNSPQLNKHGQVSRGKLSSFSSKNLTGPR